MSFILAIDGPAGAGKSTVAKLVASELGLVRVDTGALYRAVALLAVRLGLTDEAEIRRAVDRARVELRDDRVWIDEEDVSELIRTPEISKRSSEVSALPAVREALLEVQRAAARQQPKGAVLEGRDIGTVVFPDADLKIFLTASDEVRAERRSAELIAKGSPQDPSEVLREMQDRDARDRGRATAPLVRAKDAVLVDTTHRDLESIVSEISALARPRL
ncbi:MAG: (d)CMP kinase [Deltaproteobacteria bacterium]|nr:(d)CMP kinase [Deltaproteobacteria bacterium]